MSLTVLRIDSRERAVVPANAHRRRRVSRTRLARGSVALALVLVVAVAGLGPGGTGVANAAGPTGAPVDLGTLGGPDPLLLASSASGMNDRGDIVGWSQRTVNDLGHAFWRDTTGQKHDLGTLGGNDSFASGVNEAQRVVGYSHKTSDIDAHWHAFSWTPAHGMVDLRTLPGGTDSFAEGVNDAGQVVGRSNTATYDWHGFVWDAAGGMVDLRTLGGDSSFAYGINNAGKIVGTSETPSGSWHAFVWDGAHGMVDLATLGGPNSEARSINEAGQVVGQSDTIDGESHAFLWDPVSGMIDLQTLGGDRSSALGINESGLVVGGADTADGRSHAFAWDPVSGMVDLQTLGGSAAAALDINDDGAVVGSSSRASGVTHAALWPPKANLVTPAWGASYVQGKVILASYTCYPTVVACVGDVPSGAPIDTATPGPHTFTVIATDSDGTQHVVTHPYNVTADTTPPMVSLGIGEGTAYPVGSSPIVQYTCYDDAGGSGIASCVGSLPTGGAIDTSTAGSYVFTVTATDKAGNVSTVTRHYAVVGESISAGAASVVEGDVGKPRSVRFPVTLSRPASAPVTVRWTLSPSGSASSPDDVITKSGMLTFQPSARTGLTTTVKYVTAKVMPDVVAEGDETFSVTLTDPTGGYTIATRATTGTILDDDPGSGLHVDVGDSSIVEGSWYGGNAAKVTVSLSAPAATAVTVQVSVADGTASAVGGDYKPFKTKTITFKPGQWQKAIGVKVLSDVVFEGNETVLVVLSNPSTGLALGRSTGTITILDDD